FDQVGIARSKVLNKLKFRPDVVNGVPVIKVSSDSPIHEPFVNFIVEVAWPKGKLLREYTVLLDPPVLGGGSAAPVTTTANAPDVPVFVAAPETAETAVEVVPEATVTTEVTSEEGLAPFVGEAPADVETYAVEESLPLAQTEEVQMVEEPEAYAEEQVPTTNVVTTETEADTEGWLPPFVDGSFNVANAEINTYPVSEPVEEIAATEPVADETSAVSAGETYEVNRGDTLFGISKNAARGSSANIHQMMVAIQRNNPKAFVRNDMNRLKAGYILRIPDAQEAARISRAEAKAAVLSAIAAKGQGGAFQEYKSQAAKSAVPQTVVDEGSGSASGITGLESRVKSAGAVEETAATTEEKQGLEILAPEGKGTGAAGGESGEGQGVAGISTEMAKEKLESKAQESQELESRVSELESMISDKDRLIELKDEKLADLQSDVSGEAPSQPETAATAESSAGEPVPEAPETTASETAQTEEATTGGLLQESQPTSEQSAESTEQGLTESEKLAEAEPATESETSPASAEETSQPETTASEEEQTEPAATETTAETGQAAATEEAAESTGLIENIKKNPGALAGVGAGVLLLSGLAWLIFRRKEDESLVVVDHEDAELEDDAVAVEAADEIPVTEPAGEEEPLTAQIDTSDIEIEQGTDESFTDEPGTLIGITPETDEDLDDDEVLSEANVYLAYGLHDQAIDLLKPAVEAHPERNDYIAKLAEAYHATGNKEGFLEAAKKLNGTADGPDQKLFQRVAVMARDIAPESGLFSNVDVGDLTLTAITRRPDALAETGASETMAIDGDELTELSPDETQIPDLDELSKSLQMEETEALKELRESTLDVGEEELETPDKTNIHTPVPDFAKMEGEAKEGLSDLSSVPDESVAEFDSKTLSLAMGDDDGLSLDELEDDFNSLTTGADEISTKLDLAKAYIDMGDDEGAREALEEVIANGDSEQQSAAKSLLQQLK
ncbi:MAG TPA: hypothetical protein ENJ35_05835, partial [Gammaproteobacteria bacterium]|nr:hypothetical protein [Gammaproteobacteria bacterium]